VFVDESTVTFKAGQAAFVLVSPVLQCCFLSLGETSTLRARVLAVKKGVLLASEMALSIDQVNDISLLSLLPYIHGKYQCFWELDQ